MWAVDQRPSEGGREEDADEGREARPKSLGAFAEARRAKAKGVSTTRPTWGEKWRDCSERVAWRPYAWREFTNRRTGKATANIRLEQCRSVNHPYETR